MAQRETFLTMLKEVREWEKEHLGISPESKDPVNEAELKTLMESLPKSSTKDKGDGPVPDDIHARFVTALNGELLLGAKPLPRAKDLEEQKEIELPDGIHFKLLGIK